MKTMALIVLITALTGCSSTPVTRYYQLPADTAATSDEVVYEKSETQSAVWVEPVALTDALAGSGIVYQQSDVQYVIASTNLWATPLDQQLQLALIGDLSRQLPGRLISGQPLGADPLRLSVSVNGFHGRYDGSVVITGNWILDNQGTLISRSFSMSLPQSEDGYDALVATLAKGWHQESKNLADVIRNTK
ncbi:MAG: hypothetical protein XXXJIFNMEKO3_01000 [Candidatus Erwinia impunctatus]|nr:hypothetical protein XXXJIFNMEKO_01000 [Culicoides impunctatus]